MRLTFRAWFAIVALCGLLFMLSGPLPVGNAQPLPTEEADDPVEIGTLPPRIERPIRFTPTPPRERPTMVPTEELVVPTETPEPPPPPPETAALEVQVQTGTITLHKHACPREDGLALDDANDDGPLDPYAGGDQSAFLNKCPVVDAPVEFTITGGDGIDPNDEPLGNSCFALRQGSTTIATRCDASDSNPNDGFLIFEDLAAGTYLLVETRAPSAGYSITSPVTVHIVAGVDRSPTAFPQLNMPTASLCSTMAKSWSRVHTPVC